MSDPPPVLAEQIVLVPVAELQAHPLNPNEGDVDAIRASIRANGFYSPIEAQLSSGTVLTGHHSWYAAQAEGLAEVPVVWLDVDDATALRIMLADNRTASLATINERLLADALAALDELEGSGYDELDLAAIRAAADAAFGGLGGGAPAPTDRQATAGALAREFGCPPFSVLDTRQGYWQERKREWLALGLRSELGRGDVMPSGASSVYLGTAADGHMDSSSPLNGRKANAIPGGSRWPTMGPDGTIWRGDSRSRPIAKTEAEIREQATRRAADQASNVTGAPPLPDWADNGVENMAPGTSIFDPVLCELSYRWYTAPGATVLDPFAGGSVRGIVAAYCDRSYLGVDLRPEQVAANVEQWDTISGQTPRAGESRPVWVTGDSRQLDELLPAGDEFDMLFSCPPYFDLEVYSDDPDDLSRAGSYDEFLAAYQHILALAAARLRDDRFAVLVVSEIRDKQGRYRGFVPDTIRACQAVGLQLYNEAALVNMLGSLPLRVRRQFGAARKLGRSHQNVLTFVKGSPEAASAWCGPVAIPDEEWLAPATGVAL